MHILSSRRPVTLRLWWRFPLFCENILGQRYATVACPTTVVASPSLLVCIVCGVVYYQSMTHKYSSFAWLFNSATGTGIDTPAATGTSLSLSAHRYCYGRISSV